MNAIPERLKNLAYELVDFAQPKNWHGRDAAFQKIATALHEIEQAAEQRGIERAAQKLEDLASCSPMVVAEIRALMAEPAKGA